MKRLRVLPLFAAIAVLIVTAFTGSSAVASTSAPNQFPIALPAGKFLVLGAVERPQILTVADLEKLPQRTVTVQFRTPRGLETHTYTGPLLFDVLTQARPKFDPAIRNDKLRHFISFNASDNYHRGVHARQPGALRPVKGFRATDSSEALRLSAVTAI